MAANIDYQVLASALDERRTAPRVAGAGQAENEIERLRRTQTRLVNLVLQQQTAIAELKERLAAATARASSATSAGSAASATTALASPPAQAPPALPLARASSESSESEHSAPTTPELLASVSPLIVTKETPVDAPIATEPSPALATTALPSLRSPPLNASLPIRRRSPADAETPELQQSSKFEPPAPLVIKEAALGSPLASPADTAVDTTSLAQPAKAAPAPPSIKSSRSNESAPTLASLPDSLAASTMPAAIVDTDSANSADLAQLTAEPEAEFDGRLSQEDISELGQTPGALAGFRVTVEAGLFGKSTPEMRPGRDEPACVLSVSNGQGIEWHVAKDYTQLKSLDVAVRQRSAAAKTLPRLPDRAAFSSLAPSKVDARVERLNTYFGALHHASAHNDPMFATFITSHVAELRDDVTSGFLLSRTRFSGWKAKFYVQLGPHLYVLDRPGGEMQQHLALRSAKVKRIKDTDDDYRHAFSVTEHSDYADGTKPSTLVLCADSSQTLRRWIASMSHPPEAPSIAPTAVAPYKVSPTLGGISSSFASSRSLASIVSNSSVISSADASGLMRHPSIAMSINSRRGSDAAALRGSSSGGGLNGLAISGPAPASPPRSPTYRSASSLARAPPAALALSKGTAHLPPKEPRTPHSSHGLSAAPSLSARMAASRHMSSPKTASAAMLVGSPSDMAYHSSNSPVSGGNVFGAPLLRAINYSSAMRDGAELPTVVVDCVEYLTCKNAVFEEGIFRLSGTQSLVDELEQVYEQDKMQSLLEHKAADVNVVATLLKRYLRYLPESLIAGTDEQAWQDALAAPPAERIARLRRVLGQLPLAQFDLLHTVVSLLAQVAKHEDANKMSLRNLSIVFSPTLQIPGPLIAALIEHSTEVFA